MLSEIGSNFWTESVLSRNNSISDNIFNFNHLDCVFTSSGRDAIRLVLKDIGVNNRRVLLPSFTCDSVIEPFIDEGYSIAYYPILSNLDADITKLSDLINSFSPSVVFLHNYFGFNTTEEMGSVLDERDRNKFIVIEDTTQSLYSSFSRKNADYQVGSFRKWAGLPDGGYALKTNGMFDTQPLQKEADWVRHKIEAMDIKSSYMKYGDGDKQYFLRKFSEAETMLDAQKDIFCMSNYSVNVQANLNVEELKHRRRNNYRILLDGVSRIGSIKAIFNELPNNVVPLYFPVICTVPRDEIQRMLRESKIYAPIVWPQSKNVTIDCESVEHIYSSILCIPCDQRYDEEDMKRVLTVLKANFR